MIRNFLTTWMSSLDRCCCFLSLSSRSRLFSLLTMEECHTKNGIINYREFAICYRVESVPSQFLNSFDFFTRQNFKLLHTSNVTNPPHLSLPSSNFSARERLTHYEENLRKMKNVNWKLTLIAGKFVWFIAARRDAFELCFRFFILHSPLTHLLDFDQPTCVYYTRDICLMRNVCNESKSAAVHSMLGCLPRLLSLFICFSFSHKFSSSSSSSSFGLWMMLSF